MYYVFSRNIYSFLTGANQYVGNWPGVTVEKKEGKLKGKKNKNVTIYITSPLQTSKNTSLVVISIYVIS